MNTTGKKCLTLKVYLVLLLLFTALSIQIKAQEKVLVSEKHPELRYYPLKGEVYYFEYMQVKGSAFLKGDDWMDGKLTLTTGKNVDNIKFKIDVYTHKILVYQEYLKRIMAISKDDISEFYITNTDPPRKFVFIRDIPSKAKVSDGCYFEVLSEGRLSFYKLFYKDVLPLRVPQMPLLDEFLDEESYFIKDGELARSVRLKRNVLFRLYPQYKSELRQFIRREDLHLRRQDDFKIAVSYLGNVLELIENNQQQISNDVP